MKSFAILALSAMAFAAPLNKRDMAYETVVAEVTETVYTTTTVWVDEAATEAPAATSVAGFYEQHGAAPSASTQATSSAAPVAAAYVPSAAPAAPAANVQPSQASYVAPAAPTTTTTQAPAPMAPTTTAAYVAPSPTSVYVPAPAATTTAASAPSSSSGQGDHTGDITYYDVSVGLGSCGTSASNSDAVVALSHLDMNNGANPNANPLCGKMINIYYNGATHQAKVFDTCPTCDEGSLDLTQSLFEAVAPSGDGRVHGVSWSFA